MAPFADMERVGGLTSRPCRWRVMGILLAFAVGFVVGGRGGAQDFNDVVQAVRDLSHSEEFHGLVGVLRQHGAHMLRSAADLLEGATIPDTEKGTGVADRVRLLMKQV